MMTLTGAQICTTHNYLLSEIKGRPPPIPFDGKCRCVCNTGHIFPGVTLVNDDDKSSF